MLRSLLPRNLGKRLGELYKVEAASAAQTNNKAIAQKPTGAEPGSSEPLNDKANGASPNKKDIPQSKETHKD
jgi:hypothetical protein